MSTGGRTTTTAPPSPLVEATAAATGPRKMMREKRRMRVWLQRSAVARHLSRKRKTTESSRTVTTGSRGGGARWCDPRTRKRRRVDELTHTFKVNPWLTPSDRVGSPESTADATDTLTPIPFPDLHLDVGVLTLDPPPFWDLLQSALSDRKICDAHPEKHCLYWRIFPFDLLNEMCADPRKGPSDFRRRPFEGAWRTSVFKMENNVALGLSAALTALTYGRCPVAEVNTRAEIKRDFLRKIENYDHRNPTEEPKHGRKLGGKSR